MAGPYIIVVRIKAVCGYVLLFYLYLKTVICVLFRLVGGYVGDGGVIAVCFIVIRRQKQRKALPGRILKIR